MILFVSASRNVKYVLIHLDWQNAASTSLPERIRCEKVNIPKVSAYGYDALLEIHETWNSQLKPEFKLVIT